MSFASLSTLFSIKLLFNKGKKWQKYILKLKLQIRNLD